MGGRRLGLSGYRPRPAAATAGVTNPLAATGAATGAGGEAGVVGCGVALEPHAAADIDQRRVLDHAAQARSDDKVAGIRHWHAPLAVKKLRARSLRLALDQLDRDHASGEKAIRDLEHALLAFEVALGLNMEDARGAAKFAVFQLHKSVGITILVLSLARLAWRLMNPPPHYPDSMKPWEKTVAALTHWGFYGLMIGLPMIGWVIVSVSIRNIPTLLYKAIPWPHLPGLMELPRETRKVIEGAASETHEILAWITIVLLILHVGAALKHQFLTKDGVLYRMAPLPFLRPRA